MRLASLYSGGKDSTFALYLAQQSGFEVATLVTLLPEEGSWLYHVPNVKWTSLQAQAMGVRQILQEAGEGVETEIAALKTALEHAGVQGVVVGAVASDYQYTHVNNVCEELGLWVYAPLWRKDAEILLREYVEAGFTIIVVRVSAEGLGADWLGRVLDDEACEELLRLARRYGVHPVGEGGEFETLVLDGPNFHSRLSILSSEKVWEGSSGTLYVREAVLREKGRGQVDGTPS